MTLSPEEALLAGFALGGVLALALVFVLARRAHAEHDDDVRRSRRALADYEARTRPHRSPLSTHRMRQGRP